MHLFRSSSVAYFFNFCSRTCFILTSLLAISDVQAQDGAAEGEALYTQYCAACHENPVDRAPSRAALGDYNANAIVHALSSGIMQTQAANLNEEQRILLAEHLSGGEYNRDRLEQLTACANPIDSLNLTASGNWNGWGSAPSGQRFQSSANSNLSAASIDSLEVAWVFGVEQTNSARGNVTVVDGVMFFGSRSGQVYALDIVSGCHYWTYAAIGEVRAAPTVAHVESLDQTVLVFADLTNRAYAVDAFTGGSQSFSKLCHDPTPLPRCPSNARNRPAC